MPIVAILKICLHRSGTPSIWMGCVHHNSLTDTKHTNLKAMKMRKNNPWYRRILFFLYIFFLPALESLNAILAKKNEKIKKIVK